MYLIQDIYLVTKAAEMATQLRKTVTSMYNFSKQGKHFMDSITASKLRCACINDKTFTLCTTVVCKPTNRQGKHIMVRHVQGLWSVYSDKGPDFGMDPV